MVDREPDEATANARLTYARVYVAPDGETHFQDLTVAMSPTVFVPGIPLVDVGAPHPVTALTFARVDAGYTSDWHPAPRRQFVLISNGALEVTVSDGDVRNFGPGSIFFVEDTTGKGHQTRAMGEDDCVFVVVECP